jgi:tetratricopeptide (TPR) repeat protein
MQTQGRGTGGPGGFERDAGAGRVAQHGEVDAEVYRLDNLVRGYIAAAAGRHEKAIGELRRFRYLAAHLPPLGRAYEAVGAADSAIAAYERFLDMRDAHYPAWHAVHLPEVLERLGALYSARGDSARAAERYQTLAHLWRDADPELRWRADRARSLALRYTP